MLVLDQCETFLGDVLDYDEIAILDIDVALADFDDRSNEVRVFLDTALRDIQVGT
jgi:hypothetical protein